jgi:hypothetical protein
MPALAAAGPVEGAKVIAAKVLEMPASANKTRGKKRRFQSVWGKEKKSKGQKFYRRWREPIGRCQSGRGEGPGGAGAGGRDGPDEGGPRRDR